MSTDLEQKLSDIQTLTQADSNVDAAALMINALQQEQADKTETKHKRWAYLFSIGFPPLGYGVAIYYRFFSTAKDSFRTAWWCVGLTTFSLIISIVSLKIILTAATQTTGQQFNVQQFEQTPNELKAALQ